MTISQADQLTNLSGQLKSLIAARDRIKAGAINKVEIFFEGKPDRGDNAYLSAKQFAALENLKDILLADLELEISGVRQQIGGLALAA